MSQPLPRLAVFDLAGTTMQDDGSVASIFQQVLASEGLDASPEDVSRVRGASKREAFLRLTSDPARAARLFQRFMSSVRQHYATRSPVEVEGASATFAWLRERGVKVALNTGFERALVEVLIAALGWPAFDALVCGDEVEAGRPSPAMIQEAMRRLSVQDPAQVLVAGDTVLDLQAGAAARAGWIIGVTSGAHDRGRLLQVPHTQILPSIAGIPGLLAAPQIH